MGGGWYRYGADLLYRPAGHADQLITAWLTIAGEITGAEADHLITNLQQKESPGQCLKCHWYQTDGEHRSIQWRSKAKPHQAGLFNRFSHTAHWSLAMETGCKACHKLDKRDNNNEVTVVESGFVPMKKSLCLDCHTSESARNACSICHNYHNPNIVRSIPNSAYFKE